MPVYVDDMYRHPIGRFGRMKMSHMVADTRSELLAMAATIGVAAKWLQHGDNPKRIHFDVSMSKRRLAIEHGAVEIAYRDVGGHVTDLSK